MAATALQVISEIFDRLAADPVTQTVAESLRKTYFDGKWSPSEIVEAALDAAEEPTEL